MSCTQVAGLAGVSSRLESLRKQHEALEREADEVFVLQSQLPDLEAAAAQAGMLRRRCKALQAEKSQARTRMRFSSFVSFLHYPTSETILHPSLSGRGARG